MHFAPALSYHMPDAEAASQLQFPATPASSQFPATPEWEPPRRPVSRALVLMLDSPLAPAHRVTYPH